MRRSGEANIIMLVELNALMASSAETLLPRLTAPNEVLLDLLQPKWPKAAPIWPNTALISPSVPLFWHPICLALFFISNLHFISCFAEDLVEVHPSFVPLGSYLPPQGNTNNVGLVSPTGMFNLNVKTWRSSSTFYCMAGVSNVKINPLPMLWGANDALPLQVASTCWLYLSHDGDLILQYDDNKTAWRTHTAGMGVSNLTLLDSGNLVLLTKQGLIAWQSFSQNPAFALYPGMNLTSNMTVFSGASPPDSSSDFNVRGSYAMQLFNHSKLILFTNTNDSSFVYWSTSISNGPLHASTEQLSYITLDNAFTFHDNSSKALGSLPPTVEIPLNFTSSIRVALVDPTSANLLAFYRSNHTWTLFFNSSISTCQNVAHCGKFAVCNASTGACYCPPQFVQDGRDCKPKLDLASPAFPCLGPGESSSYKFVSVNVSFQSQISGHTSPSDENCTLLCAHSCVCRVALYDTDTSSCSLFSSLPTVSSGEDGKQLMLLKLPKVTHSSKKHLMVILESVCAVIAVCLCSACTIAILHCCKWRKQKGKKSRELPNEEVFLQALPRLPPKYTYKELEEATKGFSTKLGAGAFGGVYEGVLPSGLKVAVKKLEEGSNQSLVQFRAEVASIGSVSHMNLVTLKGFCHAGEGRLLVYEHMGLGSLDRWLFRKGECGEKLGWERRCKIAMDTAKGLSYLHHECGERIVHCDVKPENILLDEDFNAKVGDFGLAKLVGKDQQSFAMTSLKGTRGYLAPEWLQDATITAKSDVYSFGVVILELISGRRCLDSDYGYLPTIAFRIVSTSMIASSSQCKSQESPYKQWMVDPSNALHAAQEGNHMDSGPLQDTNSFDQSSMEALLDPSLHEDGDVTPASLERMIFIGLWCVQPNPSVRPPMTVVVQMLEGVAAVPAPPLQVPFLQGNDALSSFTSTTTSSTASLFQPLSQNMTL